MTQNKDKMLSGLYSLIAEELGITETMFKKAALSYNAVGTWLSECEPDLDISIFPQGSMGIGTTIKPITEKDEYDVDLVCLLENGTNLSAKSIKTIVGNRLKEHKRYAQMLEKEGKRCWTLSYDEFHMDILPCVPKNSFYFDPGFTAVRLTHKNELGEYGDKYSDPSAYRKWFFDQMKVTFDLERKAYAKRNDVDIEQVEEFCVKTPLQKAIQLLKRHRDVMYENNTDSAPISIIITTLAAKSYNNETDLYAALENILNNMESHIHWSYADGYVIKNPVMGEENFAEKWNEDGSKAAAFKKWVKVAQNDLVIIPRQLSGIHAIGDHLKKVLGSTPVTRGINTMGTNTLEKRNSGKLFVAGTGVTLSSTATKASAKVMEHTFYGK